MDLSVVGKQRGPWTRSWTSDDVLLYALGVGAGQDDPTAELPYTTENTAGVTSGHCRRTRSCWPSSAARSWV